MSKLNAVDEKVLNVAKKEVREDDNRKEQALVQFREWIDKHPAITNCRKGKFSEFTNESDLMNFNIFKLQMTSFYYNFYAQKNTQMLKHFNFLRTTYVPVFFSRNGFVTTMKMFKK